MSLHDLTVIILVSLLILILPAPGLYKLFKKAGIPSWKAWVPFLNTWEILKVTELKKHWWFWQLIPIVGWFISLWLFVEFIKLFGKFGFLGHAAAVLVPIIYFPYLANNQKTRFLGKQAVRNHKKSTTREWIDAGVFAVVAATLIRIFVFEAYTIPTGSMEKTLLVNDFLFVSKLSYGPRIPNTPLAVPFVHHTLPILKTKSYTEIIHLPYTRWFASPVKRNDVVVFNFPAGDTLTKEEDSQNPYYDILQGRMFQEMQDLRGQYKDEQQLRAVAEEQARNWVWSNYTIMTRPVDKRENYIKRCVGIPGDTILIRDGVLYINNQKAFISPTSATDYVAVTTPNQFLNEDNLREAGVQLTMEEQAPDFYDAGSHTYKLNLTLGEAEIVKKMPGVISVTKQLETTHDPRIYPRAPNIVAWSVDEFGPLWIPKKGATIPLTVQNIAFYKRAINIYEHNDWEERDGKIFINGKEATSYTFKMDYHWMMGDNRHRSQDSRFWGFVPEDHVVGEAWLIWMSWEKRNSLEEVIQNYSLITAMKKEEYRFAFEEYDSIDELKKEDADLLKKAREVTRHAYAPYSKFYVGAAAKMKNGEIITGTNQENASYPAGICAERVLLSVAGSLFPNMPIETIAITHRPEHGASDHPVAPCGICRQSLKEFENRVKQPVRLILAGMEGKIHVIPQSSFLLPFAFSGDELK